MLYTDPTSVGLVARTAEVARLGASHPSDPFFYPPLLAWLIHLQSARTQLATFTNILYVLQILLIPASVHSVARLTQTKMRPPLRIIISLVLVTLTLPGHRNLFQNQLQIFLTSLIILAVERAESARPIAAGSVLALAASIKLVPALFVLIWGRSPLDQINPSVQWCRRDFGPDQPCSWWF